MLHSFISAVTHRCFLILLSDYVVAVQMLSIMQIFSVVDHFSTATSTATLPQPYRNHV